MTNTTEQRHALGVADMDPETLARVSTDPSDPRFVAAVQRIAREDETLNRRGAAKLVTRAKVLAEARRQYLIHGYNRTTARGIAAGIGMSTGAVFAAFPKRADGTGGLPDIWRAVTGEPVPGDAPWTPRVTTTVGA